MTKIMVDADTQAKLRAPDGLLEVCDSTGQTLGYFVPVEQNGGAAPVRSPFSDEEIQKRRQQRVGKPLSEILKRLEGTRGIPFTGLRRLNRS
ncbi:MAG: hypothetical protein ACJ8F7_11825 [Gemmataceae bacterium]